MRFATGLVALAGLAIATPPPAEHIEGTTTLTSTKTQTKTITECHPTATDCPLHSTTSTTSSIVTPTIVTPTIITTTSAVNTTTHTPTSTSTAWSVSKNSTTSAGPTAPPTTVLPPPATDSPDVPEVPDETGTAPSSVPTDAAGSLVAHTGVLAAALFAAVAAIY